MRSAVVAAVLSCTAAVSPRSALSQVSDTAARLPAQDTVSGPPLTLEEAVATAVKNNPVHLQVVETSRTAGARRKAAYGALAPRLDASLGATYRQEGTQLVSGFQGQTSSDILQSQYFIGVTYTLGVGTFVNPRVENANVKAVEADIASSASTLRSVVAQNYLTVLADEARARLADTLIVSAQSQLDLAQARQAVGSGTALDVTRAQVNVGTQQVEAIRAHNQVAVDRLLLFQNMGVPELRNARLTTRFGVAAPTFTLDLLLDLARRQNPALMALHSRDEAAKLAVTSAKTAYIPTLQILTGWSGFTNQYTNSDFPVAQAQQSAMQGLAACQGLDEIRVAAGLPSANCSSNPQFNVTPQQEQQIRSENAQFPFGFTTSPFQVQATFSLPIFDNFQRELSVQTAIAQKNDAEYLVRQQDLRTTSDVTSGYLTLTAAVKAVEIQQQNSQAAQVALQLAEERYRVGAATFLDLQDARTQFERAEDDRIAAVFAYHQAFAVLESAVGQPLR